MIGDEGVPDFNVATDTVVAIQFTNGPEGIEFSGIVIQYGKDVIDLFESFLNFLN